MVLMAGLRLLKSGQKNLSTSSREYSQVSSMSPKLMISPA